MDTRHTSNSGIARLRFGSYDLDLKAAELRKGGSLIRLKPQPFRVLAFLAENAGAVVTREELRDRIWGAETFVDFERGLNSCITQIRSVLNDEAESPRFIETLPRRGYRFIAQVETVNGASAPSTLRVEAATAESATVKQAAPQVWRWVAAGATLLLLLIASLVLLRSAPVPAATAPSGRVMLAVLPFQNLSGDPLQEFFGDGMTEEMIAVLGGLQPERLGVIARTSAMRYKHTKKGVREIGGDLHVTYVVEGSIRREAGRARITAQLIRVSDESHIWAQSYERGLSDVISVQRDVAQQIARALAIELVPSALPALAEKSAATPAAYDAYLRGRYYLNQMNGRSFAEAVKSFEKAIALDPKYAIAYAGLADAHNLQPWWAVAPPREALARGRAAAQKALALDPNLAGAHNSLGFVQLYYDWDFASAERSFTRAIELQPGFALAHYWYAGMLSAAGRHHEAIAAIKRAQALDPFSEMVNSDAGWYFLYARRYDEAIQQCRRTIALRPNFGWTYLCIREAQLLKGQLPEAVETSKKFMELSGARPEQIAALVAADPAETLQRMRSHFLQQLERAPGRPAPGYLSYAGLGLAYLSLGEHEKAMDALERAMRDRDSAVSHFKVDPRLDPLRKNPRFLALLRKAGLS